MMSKQTEIVIAMVILAALLAGPVPAAEAPDLKSENDKMNYAIGVNLMKNVKLSGVDVDLDLVFQGMRDAYRGERLLMSDDEIRKVMAYYQTEVKQRRMQAVRAAAGDNKKAGEAFLAENAQKQGTVVLPSGLQYRVIRAGEGRKPTEADTVECSYRGTLINGTEFDSSKGGQPAALKVAQLIPGWREALKLMPVGSKWQLFIPPRLAYGERGAAPAVGPNATLIFELELLAIK
jgi:FKBP-type peptidyl-prolyl cis-trans isomerase